MKKRKKLSSKISEIEGVISVFEASLTIERDIILFFDQYTTLEPREKTLKLLAKKFNSTITELRRVVNKSIDKGNLIETRKVVNGEKIIMYGITKDGQRAVTKFNSTIFDSTQSIIKSLKDLDLYYQAAQSSIDALRDKAWEFAGEVLNSTHKIAEENMGDFSLPPLEKAFSSLEAYKKERDREIEEAELRGEFNKRVSKGNGVVKGKGWYNVALVKRNAILSLPNHKKWDLYKFLSAYHKSYSSAELYRYLDIKPSEVSSILSNLKNFYEKYHEGMKKRFDDSGIKHDYSISDLHKVVEKDINYKAISDHIMNEKVPPLDYRINDRTV